MAELNEEWEQWNRRLVDLTKPAPTYFEAFEAGWLARQPEHPAHSGHEYGGAYARAGALASGDPDWMNATGGNPEPEWEYGWEADEEVRKTMRPRGPKIMMDDWVDTPEELARFPRGRRIKRIKAGPFIDAEEGE